MSTPQAPKSSDAFSLNASYKNIVVKVGTSTLINDDGRIDAEYLNTLLSQIARVRARGIKVSLVSSGSIAAGLECLGMAAQRPDDIPTLQAAAAIGQVQLSKWYAQTASSFDMRTAQVLLTRSDTSKRSAYLHARDTIDRLLELDVLPIINENDTISTEEIRFGDNDTLAATVATLIGADLVILLSDIEGLYTADPRIDEDAQLLGRVGHFTEQIVKSAGGVGSKTGSGGMATKVEAARVLMRAGIPMVICEGHAHDAICQIVDGKPVGTVFSADDEAANDTLHARKLWIALGDKARGAIIVDDGCVQALREKGSSLLPVGVTGVTGSFAAGAVVNIRDGQGRLIGRGITRYAAKELKTLAGLHSEQIAALGGDKPRPKEAVHRDELVVF